MALHEVTYQSIPWLYCIEKKAAANPYLIKNSKGEAEKKGQSHKQSERNWAGVLWVYKVGLNDQFYGCMK